MKLRWMALAEGLGTDAKGALTLIGLSQNVFSASEYPATTKRAVLLHLAEDDASESTAGRIRIYYSVKDPSGAVVLAQTIEVQVGARAIPDLPAHADIPAEFILTLEAPGTYRICADITWPDGSAESTEVPLYVIPRPSISN